MVWGKRCELAGNLSESREFHHQQLGFHGLVVTSRESGIVLSDDYEDHFTITTTCTLHAVGARPGADFWRLCSGTGRRCWFFLHTDEHALGRADADQRSAG